MSRPLYKPFNLLGVLVGGAIFAMVKALNHRGSATAVRQITGTRPREVTAPNLRVKNHD